MSLIYLSLRRFVEDFSVTCGSDLFGPHTRFFFVFLIVIRRRNVCNSFTQFKTRKTIKRKFYSRSRDCDNTIMLFNTVIIINLYIMWYIQLARTYSLINTSHTQKLLLFSFVSLHVFILV